jgi:hypothetical protein
MADSGIDWKNHSFLNEAIWGIYGEWDYYGEWTSITEEYIDKWKHNHAGVTIPKELIDNRYIIKVEVWSRNKLETSVSDEEDDGVSVPSIGFNDDINVWALPFIVGLTKSDFNTECDMKKGSPFWNVYKPTYYPPSRVITDIKIYLVRKNACLLDLTWVD